MDCQQRPRARGRLVPLIPGVRAEVHKVRRKNSRSSHAARRLANLFDLNHAGRARP
jgi:hypothetical protein